MEVKGQPGGMMATFFFGAFASASYCSRWLSLAPCGVVDAAGPRAEEPSPSCVSVGGAPRGRRIASLSLSVVGLRRCVLPCLASLHEVVIAAPRWLFDNG